MKFVILLFLILSVQTSRAKEVKVLLLDSGLGVSYQTQVRESIRDCLLSCPSCHFSHESIYGKKSDISESVIWSKLNQIKGYDLLLLGWNYRSSEKTTKLEKKLQALIDGGTLIVAAGGEVNELNKEKLPLRDTVMGHVKGLYLIGEKDRRGQLNEKAHYGPEYYTVLNPPEKKSGSFFTSALFACKMASALAKNEKSEVLEKMKINRAKSLKLYPDISEIFSE